MGKTPNNFRPKEDFRFMGAWIHKYTPTPVSSYRERKKSYRWWFFVCQAIAVLIGYFIGRFFFFI